MIESNSEFIYQFLLNSAKHYMKETDKGNNLNITNPNINNKNKQNFIKYMEHKGIDGLEYFCDILTYQIVETPHNNYHFSRVQTLFGETSQNTSTPKKQNVNRTVNYVR